MPTKKDKGGRRITHGFARRGMKRPREYNCWMHMIGRCTNPNHVRYSVYGAKGITVCKRWRKFENFFEDMGKAPSPAHTLDRHPNQKGNYMPGNVRWATKKEQARNTKKNLMLSFNGETLCAAEWAERLGFSTALIYNRISAYGWSVEKALTTPVLNPILNLTHNRNAG